MTVEFKQKQIGSRERELNRAYIGYFAPNGELIDYNLMFGEEGHDSWRNPVSIAFLKYVSYIVKDTAKDIEGLKTSMIENLKYPGIEDDVLIGIGRHRHNYNEIDKEKLINVLNLSANYLKNKNYRDEYDEFTYALLLFFQKAYSNGKFFDTIGKKIM